MRIGRTALPSPLVCQTSPRFPLKIFPWRTSTTSRCNLTNIPCPRRCNTDLRKGELIFFFKLSENFCENYKNSSLSLFDLLLIFVSCVCSYFFHKKLLTVIGKMERASKYLAHTETKRLECRAHERFAGRLQQNLRDDDRRKWSGHGPNADVYRNTWSGWLYFKLIISQKFT